LTSSSQSEASIGIFDSGIGGLTVLRALKEHLPQESFLYLGDTARLPYGTKSSDTIRRYLQQNLAFMTRRGVKALVVACNTASSVLTSNSHAGFPVFGVVEPGARAAARVTRNGKVGVLGTSATVASGAYPQALQKLNQELEIIQTPCPLLVPLVEEGWEEDPITRDVLRRYLEVPMAQGVDTLILGCTHYPVLKPVIQDLVGNEVALVDSAEEIAAQLKTDLETGTISRGHGRAIRIMTTDTSLAFQTVGARILQPYVVNDWHWADIEEDKGK